MEWTRKTQEYKCIERFNHKKKDGKTSLPAVTLDGIEDADI